MAVSLEELICTHSRVPGHPYPNWEMGGCFYKTSIKVFQFFFFIKYDKSYWSPIVLTWAQSTTRVLVDKTFMIGQAHDFSIGQ